MITMLYAGLCVLLVVFLGARVAAWRFRHKIGLGDGGDKELIKRVRAHANATEYLPLALLLLGGMELNGQAYDGLWLHVDQPAQDGFLHLLQVIARHMVMFLYQLEPAERRRVRAIWAWGVDCRGRWIATMPT